MDGLYIKVTKADGDTDTFPLRPRMIVAIEQKYGKGLAKLLGEDQKMEHIYFAAWLVLKGAGQVVKPFGDDFYDTLAAAEFTTDPNSESTETA